MLGSISLIVHLLLKYFLTICAPVDGRSFTIHRECVKFILKYGVEVTVRRMKGIELGGDKSKQTGPSAKLGAGAGTGRGGRGAGGRCGRSGLGKEREKDFPTALLYIFLHLQQTQQNLKFFGGHLQPRRQR